MSLEARDHSRAPLRRTPNSVALLGEVPIAISLLVAVALLRAALGGASSGLGVLSLIPVFYVALYGRDRRSLLAVLGALTVLQLAPILLIGAPGYPVREWREATMMIVVSGIVGLVTQQLVSGMREQTLEATRREQMLVRVGAVVRELFASADPRTDMCRATLEISDASVAVLFEADHVTGSMRSSALAGIDGLTSPLVIAPQDLVAAALMPGRNRLVSGSDAPRIAGEDLWEQCGRPGSMLFQPLQRGENPLGMLVVGWDAAVPVAGGRETVVELLAHEAAVVIDRADALEALAGMADTDPLTGLPNRRAWDARLKHALLEDEAVTIAMLDIDHFKRFNDTYGHPAGDRLLRDTAAAWRELLRADDLLARLGGEEFGLLLVGCTQNAADDVTDRLRHAVTEGQTCSAGLAIRKPGEPIESVLGRADHALYDAKAYGRDKSRTAA